MDAQRQPGAVRAQLRRGVLLLLFLHAFKPPEQAERRKALDDDNVLIWGGQGPAEAQAQWGWTQCDIRKDSSWIVAGRPIIPPNPHLFSGRIFSPFFCLLKPTRLYNIRTEHTIGLLHNLCCCSANRTNKCNSQVLLIYIMQIYVYFMCTLSSLQDHLVDLSTCFKLWHFNKTMTALTMLIDRFDFTASSVGWSVF